MLRLRIALFIIFTALSLTWAQGTFNIYKDGSNLGTGTVNTDFTYRDSDVFSVGPDLVDNEEWCWALTVAPTACLNGTAEYTPIILENPASNYTWNIVITRKSDGATRTLNLTINVRPSHAVTFTTNGGLPIPLEQTVLDGDKATEPGVSPTKTGYDFNGWDFDFDTEIKAPVAIPAKWDAIEYDITYILDGGSGPESGTYTIETAVTLPTPTKDEYTFGGWYTDDTFSGTAVTTISPGNTGDTTFYAKWTIIEYTITYVENGGTGAPTGTKYNVTTLPVTLPTAPTMQKNGYEFAGWYTDATLTTGPVATIPTGSNSNKTFYAKWNPITYTITYEQNEGEGATNGTYTIESSTITLPIASAMSKAGYLFDGWYDNPSFLGSTILEITNGSYGDKTFYAKWGADTYNITYVQNGGTGATDGTYTIGDTPIILPIASEMSRNGYTFGGWYDNLNLSGTAVTTITVGTTGDKTFYAKWNPEPYTITYEQNGGEGATNGTYTIESPTITLPTDPAMQKNGYTFGGWYENSGFSGSPILQITSGDTGDKTFYAKWNAITYNITYEPNGGDGTTSGTYTVENTPITLHTPTKSEYTFLGWYTNSAFSGTAVTSIPLGSTGDKDFYAKWEIKEYTITYEQNGGEGATNGTYTYQSPTITLPIASEMSRTGYTFGGWHEDPDFLDSPILQITSGDTGDKTFYAKWNPSTHTVTFNANCPSTSVDPICPTPNPTSKTVTYDAAIGFLETLSELTDYDFVGWFTTADTTGGTKYTATTPYTINSNTTLYARWEIKKFTIRWILDGATIRADDDVPYGTTTLTPPPTPGYTIDSWNSSFPIDMDYDFIADWSLIPYTITYNANGGTIDPSSPNGYNIKSGTVTLLPATKNCIGFDGWFDNASFTGFPISSFIPNATNLGDKTFYAKWADKMIPTTDDLDYTIPSTTTYSGYEQPITQPSLNPASSACGLEAPTILYNGISTPPKNAGSYTVQASFGESGNYKAATITLGTLDIDKATIPTPNVSATVTDKAYDATTTAQITDISLDVQLLGDDQISPSNYSITSPNFDDANAGQAKTVTANITWNLPNYDTQSWPTTITTTANITKATGYLVIQAPESYELSNPISPSILEKNSFVAANLVYWEYRRIGSNEYSTTLPRRVGEWIVKAWFNETDNYTGAADSAEFFVERGNATTVAHNITIGENFDPEPTLSNNQLNYFAANACNLKNANIHITIIEEDIFLTMGNSTNPPNSIDENGFYHYIIPRTFDKLGQDTVIYTLRSSDGIYSEQDTIIIEIPIPFENLTMQKWNNVLFINNNPLTNGGYEFKDFQWFKNGNTIGEMQFYSAGPSSKDTLNPNDIYKVIMHTTNGMRISTCEGNSKSETKLGLTRSDYQKQVLGINGKTAKTGSKVYNIKGRPIKNTPAGIYIVGENE